MAREALRKKNSKRVQRVARNALGHAVLIGLAATAGAALITAPGLTEITRYMPHERRNPEAIGKAFDSLYRKGYVLITGTKGARKAQITDKGRRQAYLNSLTKRHVNSKGWDGTWFFVSFDIPAGARQARAGFRSKLKLLGFIQYQKSLYVHPHGQESDLDFLASFYNVERYTTYFYGADLKDDAALRKRFGL